MTSSAPINQGDVDALKESQQANQLSRPQGSEQAGQVDDKKNKTLVGGFDAILAAYYIMYQTVQTDHQQAKVQENQLQINAIAQGNVIGQENMFKFTVGEKLHGSATKKEEEIQKMTAENENTSAMRNFFMEKLTVLHQSAQVGETQFNTVANNTEQTVQQGSGLLQMLARLTGQVSRI